MAKFIRCGSKNVAKHTKNRWALDKGKTTTEALAVYLGNYKDKDIHFQEDEDISIEDSTEAVNDKEEETSHGVRTCYRGKARDSRSHGGNTSKLSVA
jgi:hypothetical protein